MNKRSLFTMAVFAVAMVIISASVADAQRGGRGGGGRGERGGFGRGFGGFGGGGTTGLVMREDVQAELKLTDDQIEEIEEMMAAARENRGNRFGGIDFRNQSEEERREAFAQIREQFEKQAKEQREKIGSILNSKQNDRLSELAFQFALSRGRAQDALVAGGVELSDDDREKLDDASEDIEAKMNAQIAEIRLNAQKEIMASVVSESQIERMMGKPFEFARQERGFGRGGGGERGGRGERGNRASRRPSSEDDSDDEAEDNNRRRRRRG